MRWTTAQTIKVVLRTFRILPCRHPRAYNAAGYRWCDDCTGMWRLPR